MLSFVFSGSPCDWKGGLTLTMKQSRASICCKCFCPCASVLLLLHHGTILIRKYKTWNSGWTTFISEFPKLLVWLLHSAPNTGLVIDITLKKCHSCQSPVKFTERGNHISPLNDWDLLISAPRLLPLKLALFLITEAIRASASEKWTGTGAPPPVRTIPRLSLSSFSFAEIEYGIFSAYQ